MRLQSTRALSPSALRNSFLSRRIRIQPACGGTWRSARNNRQGNGAVRTLGTLTTSISQGPSEVGTTLKTELEKLREFWR
jgi:hypothetical protein